MKPVPFSLALLVGLALLLSACNSSMSKCTDEIGCVDIAPDEPIHIAYLLTMSGATASFGRDSLGAIEIAIEDRGKLLGHEILLTGEDLLCSVEGGQTAATKLTKDPALLGIIGTDCSSAVETVMGVVGRAGLVMLSPSNTFPGLTDPNIAWVPGYFQTAPNHQFQGQVAASFVYSELGARTAATIHDGSPYAEQLQQAFADSFTELGGTVTYRGAVNVGESDMSPVLTAVAAGRPDVLYFPIFEPEGASIAAQSLKTPGLEDTVLVGANGLFSASFPAAAGPNADGMYLSGPNVSGAAYNEFLLKWDAKFGGPPPGSLHAFAFDAANILLDAIENVAVEDADGTLRIRRKVLRDAIAATTSFKGLTGTLSCSEFGGCATSEALGMFRISMAEVNDAKWPPELVYTP